MDNSVLEHTTEVSKDHIEAKNMYFHAEYIGNLH